jgi:hypothetical protein
MAEPAEGNREIHGDRGLPNSAFSGANCNQIADALDWNLWRFFATRLWTHTFDRTSGLVCGTLGRTFGPRPVDQRLTFVARVQISLF